MKKILTKLVIGILVLICIVIMINIYIVSYSEDKVFTNVEELSQKQTIIILGCLVRGNDLSMVLEDRVMSGMRIFNSEKGQKLLLSGDHGRIEYDEVNSMKEYIQSNYKNVEDDVIFMDHAGFDTYDSLYRAKEIFDVESAIIVTQDFHVYRSVYIANKMGIDAVGFSVNEEKYSNKLKQRWAFREKLSRVKAYFDVVLKSKPKYLGEKIPITGDGRITWDKED